MDALRDRSAAAWMKLFDDRWMRTQWPYGSGVWGKREWVAPDVTDEDIVSTSEGGTNVFWADRLGKEIGLPDLWIKLCGNSHTGSFKDLGMTVLVSVVRQAVARGRAKARVLCCASHRRHERVARRLRRGRRAARRGAPAARHGLGRAARAAARPRRARARARDRLRRVHGHRQGARPPRPRLPRQLDEPPAHRGAEDRVASRSSQQFDWESPDWVILPSGNLGNAAALYAGFRMMLELGLVARLPRLCVAQAERANPMYRAFVAGKRRRSRPSTPRRRWRAPSRSATR